MWAKSGVAEPPGEADEIDAQVRARIVEQGHRPVGLGVAWVVPAREAISGRDVTAQELVQRDVELRRQVEQRLEREATPSALDLRDGGGDNVMIAYLLEVTRTP